VLVMFLHPQCPCSHASVVELARLVSTRERLVDARVLVLRPPDEPEEWCDTRSVRAAREIPGVTVSVDDGGREARLFGATTSGHVVVYSGGALVFSGGITPARGHEGDNPGFDTALAAISGVGRVAAVAETYGCDLWDGEAERRGLSR
jgi:hypothetical protein